MREHPSHMPPIRTRGEMLDDKRAIEAEHTPQAVTYTFLSEMSPPPIEMEPVDLSFATAHDNSAPATPQRTSHGRRRDASYIPRPPNAFILFRSSFIRDQKVTNKVEGNHSNLSKIIGMYWKTLTKEQRDEWEAKAAQALVDHRKRYPDWRFRHAANASASVKQRTALKDGARRGRARKDPPDRGGPGAEEESEEGTGRERAMTRAEEEESRLTKIAGLLVEGQEGEALERAVEEWEAERRLSRRSVSVSTAESALSSPVMTRASASVDRESTPSTLTLAMSPSSSMSASCSPVMARACASMNPDPPPPPAASETPALTPSLSVLSSPVITRASTTERDPSFFPCSDTATPKDIPPSSPNTPRLSVSTSTSGSLLKSPPSWPASPATPQSIASTASRPLLWPTSPATPRTPTSSFPAFTSAEHVHWEVEHRLTRSNSTSISVSACSSPIVTRASASTVNGELSAFMTRASSSMDPEPTPPPTSASALVLSPSLSVSMSASPSRASTMEREPEQSTLTSAPSLLSCFDISAPSTILSSSSPGTPLISTPSRPVPIPKWPASPMTPRTASASTSIPWPTSPGTPRLSTSFPAFTRAEEWEVGLGCSISKSALSSPVVTRATSTTDGEPSTSTSTSASALGPTQSASCVYTPSTPKDVHVPLPSVLSSTSTPPVPIPIPKPPPPPSWPASPSTPHAASTPVAWPTSPVTPRISTSFPAFTRAEDWEMGHRAARSNSNSTNMSEPVSVSVSTPASTLSSPIVIRTSTSSTTTTDGEPSSMLDRASCSPIITRTTPVPALSWPASPVSTPSWSNAPTSPATPHVPTSTPTSTTPAAAASRRSRPRSRSPTFRSPQNPNAPMSMKRSLSAPAPHRDHHRQQQEQQQEPVRMGAGFWWPAPHEQESEYGGSRAHVPEQEAMGLGMQMQMGVPMREGSFDAFDFQDRETEPEHEYGIGPGGETNEWGLGWNWSDLDSDSKSTSMYSPIPVTDQIAPTSAAPTDPHYPRDSTPDERWFNPWDADTTIRAGDSLHPLPPTPISPIPLSPTSPLSPSPFSALALAHAHAHTHTPTRAHRSSFSSLAGWDGTSPEPANANANPTSASASVGVGMGGTCAAVKATVAGIGGMMWSGGGLQRLGVQGGGYAADCQWVG